MTPHRRNAYRLRARSPPRSCSWESFHLAEAELATALRIARAQGLAYEEAQALRTLAALAELQGREADAADALQEAERLMQRVGDNG